VALGETGDWNGATERIINMIRNGAETDPLGGGLPWGYGADRTLEKHARLFAESNSVDLAMIMPVLLTAYSAATQGAFLAPLYSEDWTPNHVPLVFQFFGIAESGARKSTVIKEGKQPLEAAMTEGVVHRQKLCSQWKAEALKAAEHLGLSVDKFGVLYDKIYGTGICPSTFADSGTQEGVRNKLVFNGGHRVVITGESDILREVGSYSKNGGGSLGLMIRGWDQDVISVDRAAENSHLYIAEGSLPFLIFVQPSSFNEFTKPNAQGYDEFLDKGVFGRAWLWKMPKPVVPEGFVFKPKPKNGELSPLAQARIVTAERLALLVERSDEYRARKAIHWAWEREGGAAAGLEEPERSKRELLTLDGQSGVEAFVRVQNMLLDLRRALEAEDAMDPGISAQFHPLVARFTDHVMRLAALLSLADDPGATAVDTQHIVDVATRLMPWLWSGWVEVMDFRRTAVVEEIVAESSLKNLAGVDLTMGAKVLGALARLEADHGPSAVGGFKGSEVTGKARNLIPPSKRKGVDKVLRKVLETMADDGKLVQRLTTGGQKDAFGKVAPTFRLTPAGQLAAAQHAKK
jgi:Protein of unknown function (DUF3987)